MIFEVNTIIMSDTMCQRQINYRQQTYQTNFYEMTQ